MLLLGGNFVLGQAYTIQNFSYISPEPFSRFVTPESTIAFRLSEMNPDFNNITVMTVDVVGSESNEVHGKLYLADDQLTCIFQPDQSFVLGEQVFVGIQTQPQAAFYYFDFTIGLTNQAHQKKVLTDLMNDGLPFGEPMTENKLEPLHTASKDLPPGLPDIAITHDNYPSPGYFFLGTVSNKSRANEFIAIYDNQAYPVFYRELIGNTPSDFKIQLNGNLSYHGRTFWEFYELNPFFEVIDTIRAGNGLLTDNHELLILENGHKFLLVHDAQLVDMSLVVSGGNPMATVIGLVVQELDQNNEVVFQWRSWDHFEITDAADRINLTGSIIDYVHGNSIELDTDTSMIISCRNMDEVTRINRNTGEIMWRLGGKRNQFEWDDSTQLFCHQHDARIIPGNGHLSVFDNGNCHDPQYSSAAEYLLDVENMTVTLVDRLRSTPDIYGSFMGNAQRLENGRTIVGWGSGIPSITEFDESGEIALQFSFNNINYRAFKFNWQSPILTANVDSLIFDTIQPHDSITKQISLTNHFQDDLIINEVFFQNEGYQLLDHLPVVMEPGEEKTFTIQFKASMVGDYPDVVTFCEDINTDTLKQRVSHQVFIKGQCQIQSSIHFNKASGFIKVYPNPFTNQITINSEQSGVTEVQVYDGVGVLVLETKSQAVASLNIEVNLPTGFYLLLIKTKENQVYRTHLIRTSGSK